MLSFQQVVQEDTDRRIKELGDDFCFSYTGGALQILSLDSTFRASLHRHAIRAQTVTCYTFMDKMECISSDTSFYRSFIPLKEFVFGANRTIVLQAFVQFPFLIYSR